MYEDVKTQLHKSFDSLDPDFLEQILSAEVTKVASEEELFYEINQENRHNSFRSFCQIGSVVAAAVFVCILSVFAYTKKHVVGTIKVEDQSSVILSVNRYSDIVKVEIEDPTIELQEKDIEGKKVDEGLDQVLTAMKDDDDVKDVMISYGGSAGFESTKNVINQMKERYNNQSEYVIKTKEETVKPYELKEVYSVQEEESTEQFIETGENKEPVSDDVATETVENNKISALAEKSEPEKSEEEKDEAEESEEILSTEVETTETMVEDQVEKTTEDQAVVIYEEEKPSIENESSIENEAPIEKESQAAEEEIPEENELPVEEEPVQENIVE